MLHTKVDAIGSPSHLSHVVADQSEVINFLANNKTHGIAGPVERIDTHGAVIFLAGEHAYKLKRAVTFPFMDLSTIGKRQWACQREVEVNHPNAPDIYLDAVPIVREGGHLKLNGEGEVVDWVVRMHRFDESKTLDRLAGTDALTASVLVDVVETILQCHRRAAVRDGYDAAVGLERFIQQNDEALRESPWLFKADDVSALTEAAGKAFDAYYPLMIERGKAGFVRRCHGDLHLRNIAMIDRRPTLFDAIEFDEGIAICDVLYDLAFLLMDLWDRRLYQEANMVLNRYLWLAGEDAHISGLAALPLFLSIRAALRAKIAAAAALVQPEAKVSAMETEARRYFDLARRFLAKATPRLVAIGGLSGTGKSTLAGAIAPFIGTPPGAVILRSDIERKHLAGVAETQRLPAQSYSPARSAFVYETLHRKASLALKAGYSVILDAVHGQLPERNVAEGIALQAGVAFTGIWLDAPISVMIERVTRRTNDVSDADAAVVQAQSGYDLGMISWHRLEANVDPKDLANEALCLLALRQTGHIVQPAD
jgi:aminoglycoside phosphotransferase family enzyme/predicted kinase